MVRLNIARNVMEQIASLETVCNLSFIPYYSFSSSLYSSSLPLSPFLSPSLPPFLPPFLPFSLPSFLSPLPSSSVPQLDEQILLLVSKQKQLQSSSDKYKKIIAFHSYLQSRFSVVFPSCRLVPFGSFVTEQTTPTSDFDLLLCTEWTETDQAYLGDILDRFFSSGTLIL